MKKTSRFILTILLMFIVAGSLAACSKDSKKNDTNNSSDKDITEDNKSNGAKDIVNIGVTDSLSSVNPLLQDGTEVVKYTTSLAFLPLMELNKDLEFVSQLAKDITTEDNKTFIIHLDERAVWSDGEPITSEDVVFTYLLWTSPEIGSVGMSMEKIEGTGDDGYAEQGASSISGVVALDEHTVQI